MQQIEKERDEAALEFQAQKDAEMMQRKMDEEQRKLQFKERQKMLLVGQKVITLTRTLTRRNCTSSLPFPTTITVHCLSYSLLLLTTMFTTIGNNGQTCIA